MGVFEYYFYDYYVHVNYQMMIMMIIMIIMMIIRDSICSHIFLEKDNCCAIIGFYVSIFPLVKYGVEMEHFEFSA